MTNASFDVRDVRQLPTDPAPHSYGGGFEAPGEHGLGGSPVERRQARFLEDLLPHPGTVHLFDEIPQLRMDEAVHQVGIGRPGRARSSTRRKSGFSKRW